MVHNSEDVARMVSDYGLDLGIILGSRILKPVAIDCFRLGVMNMHPGVLPENRGLDNIKWAILKGLDQGVTTHLINKKIDMGTLIEKEVIGVYPDDTLVDIHVRIQDLEQKLMISSIKKLQEEGTDNLHMLTEGEYHKSVPAEIEQTLMEKFEIYKRGM